MANLWIYHGPTITKTDANGNSVIFRDGQYFMELSKNFGNLWTTIRGNTYSGSSWKYCDFTFDQSTNESTTSIGFFEGRLRRMWVANSQKWGSHNYHSPSGGNYYTLRRQTRLIDADGAVHHTLPAGYRVIIGRNQGFINGSRTALRCWGYQTSGGTNHETNGLYCQELFVTQYPNNYRINTI